MVFIVTTYIGHLFMFSWELGVYHITPDDVFAAESPVNV